MELFHLSTIPLTKCLFFTGKGGVDKTSIACATAVSLIDDGKRILLISTDSTPDLQDVFSMKLVNKGTSIPDIPNLVAASLDPIQATVEYREDMIAPYRSKLPESVIVNVEEQLSGSCTVEIAAFNELSNFTIGGKAQQEYDYIIFDATPTGHTLRMLQLPSAWSNLISENIHGTSCLGRLSGLENRKVIYEQAVETLANRNLTTLILVTHPETVPLEETERASNEFSTLGIHNQILVVDGVLTEHSNALSFSLYEKQQIALTAMPESPQALSLYMVPPRAYNVTGLSNVRALLNTDHVTTYTEMLSAIGIPSSNDVIDELAADGKRVIFTMGRGGIGEATVAAAVALGFTKHGKRVHLTATDSAAHLRSALDETSGVSMSHIDEAGELKKYQSEVFFQAYALGMSDGDISCVEEDLRPPYTQKIAVFRAFVKVVEKTNDQVVVIDTAPTGHTLLLLRSTQSYNHEVEHTKGEIPESVKRLSPRLKSNGTEVVIVTLPEVAPFYEALRLEGDPKRAEIAARWWIINQSLYGANITNPILAAKAADEVEWLNRIDVHVRGQFTLIAWNTDEIKGGRLLAL